MNSSCTAEGRFCRPAAQWPTFLMLTAVAALLVPATVCLAIISKVNVRNTGESTTASVSVDGTAGFAAAVTASNECPVVIGSLVVNNGETGEVVRAIQDGIAIDYNLSVTPQQESLLGGKLEKTAIFNPATQDLFSVKLIPVSCDGPTTFEIEYKVFDEFGGIVIPRRLFAGGTTEADLDDGLPLSNLEVIRGARITGFAIPAVSTWGVAVMVLLLLVVARMYYGRRIRAA